MGVNLQEHPLYSGLGQAVVHFGEAEHEESCGLEPGIGRCCESSFRSFRLRYSRDCAWEVVNRSLEMYWMGVRKGSSCEGQCLNLG